MRRLLSALGLVLFVWACAAPPPLQPLPAGRLACGGFFLHGRWQFVHRLTFKRPDGKPMALLGVTVVSTREKRIQSALMTPEGMVLFEAEDGPVLTVRKSMGPFDRPGFARGLMNDVEMIFLAPDAPASPGRFDQGGTGCRYRLADGGLLDTIWEKDGARRIVRYDASGRRVRRVNLSRGAPAKGKMVLTAFGNARYEIEMEGVEAVRVGE